MLLSFRSVLLHPLWGPKHINITDHTYSRRLVSQSVLVAFRALLALTTFSGFLAVTALQTCSVLHSFESTKHSSWPAHTLCSLIPTVSVPHTRMIHFLQNQPVKFAPIAYIRVNSPGQVPLDSSSNHPKSTGQVRSDSFKHHPNQPHARLTSANMT